MSAAATPRHCFKQLTQRNACAKSSGVLSTTQGTAADQSAVPRGEGKDARIISRKHVAMPAELRDPWQAATMSKMCDSVSRGRRAEAGVSSIKTRK
jgi:hypothetical protein